MEYRRGRITAPLLRADEVRAKEVDRKLQRFWKIARRIPESMSVRCIDRLERNQRARASIEPLNLDGLSKRHDRIGLAMQQQEGRRATGYVRDR